MLYEGPELKACMNGSYVLDFLEAASGASLELAFKDANTQALFADGPDHLGVLMLMR